MPYSLNFLNPRNTETNTNIIMKKKASIRKAVTTRKDTRKKVTRRREDLKRDTLMKTTRDTRTRKDMNHTTLITKSTARREASMAKAHTDSNTEEVEAVDTVVIIKRKFVNCFKEAFMYLILIQIYFHNTTSMK